MCVCVREGERERERERGEKRRDGKGTEGIGKELKGRAGTPKC